MDKGVVNGFYTKKRIAILIIVIVVATVALALIKHFL